MGVVRRQVRTSRSCRGRWKESTREQSRHQQREAVASATWCPGWPGGVPLFLWFSFMSLLPLAVWISVIFLCDWVFAHLLLACILSFQGSRRLGRGFSALNCMLGWAFQVWNLVLREPVCLVLPFVLASLPLLAAIYYSTVKQSQFKFRTRLIWIKFCQWRGELGSLVFILLFPSISPLPLPSWSWSFPSQ